jgi:signal transduction histidine kinase
VDLQLQNGHLVVRIQDSGKGINKNVLEYHPDTIGIGLGGMRQRVKEFGGEFRLENCHPGTLVEINIPTAHCLSQEESTKAIEDNLLAVAATVALPVSTQLTTGASASEAQDSSVSLSVAVSNKSARSSLAAPLPV